jgi:hypothetical protein
MADEKFEDWAHVKFTEREIADQLDAMVSEDGTDRSKFMRWLIRQEWKRRAGGAHWVRAQVDKPLAGVKIIDRVVKVKAVAS